MERQDMTLYPSLIHELINGLNLLSDYVSNKKYIYKYKYISFWTIGFKQVRITTNSDIGNSFQGEGKYILKKKSKEFYIHII